MQPRINIDSCHLLDLPRRIDRHGNLTSLHEMAEVPFEMKRIFYLYDIPGGESRGAHAHKECHQFFVATSGSFEIRLSDGLNERIVMLNRPYIGLHVPPGIWTEARNFSSGSICLVIASHFYSEEDYIRSYDEFVVLRKQWPN